MVQYINLVELDNGTTITLFYFLYFANYFVAGDDTLCTGDQFRCLFSTKCIPYSWVCDHENDCFDASDEERCTGKQGETTRDPFL